MDTLIEAASTISDRFPGLCVAIAGAGRDRHRLERLAGHAKVKVEFLGKLPDSDLADFYACADVFALCCRSRWWGLEEEGFGIVLVEAAAAGLPCVTVDSGGAGEAVRDGETGIVVNMADAGSGRRRDGTCTPRNRADVEPVADALASLLSSPPWPGAWARPAVTGPKSELSYDALAKRLAAAIDDLGSSRRPATGKVGAAVLRPRYRAPRWWWRVRSWPEEVVRSGGAGYRENGHPGQPCLLLPGPHRLRAVPGVGGRHQGRVDRRARRPGQAGPGHLQGRRVRAQHVLHACVTTTARRPPGCRGSR